MSAHGVKYANRVTQTKETTCAVLFESIDLRLLCDMTKRRELDPAEFTPARDIVIIRVTHGSAAFPIVDIIKADHSLTVQLDAVSQ